MGKEEEREHDNNMVSKKPSISLLTRKNSVNLQHEQTSAVIHIYQLKGY